MTDTLTGCKIALEQAWASNRERAAKITALDAALNKLLNRYVEMVNSGDCGKWNPETDQEVIASRAAIAMPPAAHIHTPEPFAIKLLVWTKNPDTSEGGLLAKGVGNLVYHVMQDGWTFHRAMNWKPADSLQMALAAAQADHETRIISHIVTPATEPQQPVAWRIDHIWPKGGKTSPTVTFDQDNAEEKSTRPDRYKVTPLYQKG